MNWERFIGIIYNSVLQIFFIFDWVLSLYPCSTKHFRSKNKLSSHDKISLLLRWLIKSADRERKWLLDVRNTDKTLWEIKRCSRMTKGMWVAKWECCLVGLDLLFKETQFALATFLQSNPGDCLSSTIKSCTLYSRKAIGSNELPSLETSKRTSWIAFCGVDFKLIYHNAKSFHRWIVQLWEKNH